jgi:hypothetical protein
LQDTHEIKLLSNRGISSFQEGQVNLIQEDFNFFL